MKTISPQGYQITDDPINKNPFWEDAPVPPGEGIPPGGTEGQALVKASDLDYDTKWKTISGGGGGGDVTLTEVKKLIKVETDARIKADNTLTSKITTETTEREQEDTKISENVSRETLERKEADRLLNERIDNITPSAGVTEQRVKELIQVETTAREKKEKELKQEIDDNAGGIAEDGAEILTLKQKDSELESSISNLKAEDVRINKRIDSLPASGVTEEKVRELIQVETTAREEADRGLQSKIEQETSARQTAIQGVNSEIKQEVAKLTAIDEGFEKRIKKLEDAGGGGDYTGCYNFQILNGLTKPIEGLKNNTLWLKTSDKIGEWVISDFQPLTRGQGTALKNNDIWIETANNSYSTFTASTQYGIIVPIFNVHQYKQGKWYQVVWELYQDEAWVDNKITLLDTPKKINKIDFFNGYWYTQSSSYPFTTYNNENVLYFYSYDSNYSGTSYYGYSYQPYDLTNIDSVSINMLYFSGSGSSTYMYIEICSARPSGSSSSVATSNSFSSSGTYYNQLLTVDTKSLTGIHYLQFKIYSYGSGASTNAYVDQIYFTQSTGEN